jgi:hypothetical protein
MRRLIASVIVAATLGCNERVVDYRGAGLHVDTLPTDDIVNIYRATLAGSFTLTDRSLSLLIDPVLLPRSSGLSGGDTMPPELVSKLQHTGLVRGVCRVPIRNTPMPLVCRADEAGYVVRFSPPYAMGSRDTVQVHLVVQQYAIPNGPVAERMRFERAYQLARRDASTWRATREARLPQP